MLALLFLLTTTWCGYSIVKKIFPFLSEVETWAAGWLVGVLAGSWIALALIAVAGYTAGLVGSLAVFIIIIGKLRSSLEFKKISVSKSLLLFVGAWLILFSVLFWRSSLRQEPDGWHTTPYTYGDLAFHTTIIKYFGQQTRFSLDHPLVLEQSIKYPFLLDFHSALLVRFGLSLQLTLILVGILSCASILVLLYSLCAQMSKSSWTTWWASGLYFLNGGLGWLLLFNGRENWPQLFSRLQALPIDYTNSEPNQLFWTNVVTTHILPQRGFMFGLAITLLFLLIFQHLWKNKKMATAPLMALSTIIGLLPLFHTHSFLFLLPLFGWLLGWAYYTKKVGFKDAGLVLLPAVVLGTGQLVYQLSSNHTSLQLQLGWLANGNWAGFWLQNMGLELIILLILPAMYFFRTKKLTFTKLLIIPCWAVFVLCNIFIFQKYDWDNMKFLMIAFLPMVIVSSLELEILARSLRQKIIVTIAVLITCIAGILSITYVLQNDWLLASKEQLQLAEKVIAATSPESVIVTGGEHNHLVPMLTGRRIVLGYQGWLWSHGVEFAKQAEWITNVYAGGKLAEQTIDDHGINYVYIGKRERAQYAINQQYFSDRYQKIIDENGVVLYKVR